MNTTIDKNYSTTITGQVDKIYNRYGNEYTIEVITTINNEGLIESSKFQVSNDFGTIYFHTDRLGAAYNWIKYSS